MTVSEIIQIIANFSVIVGIFFIASQVMIAARTFRMDLDQRKKDRSFQYIARWNDIDFNRMRRSVLIRFKNITKENFAKEVPQIESDIECRGNTHLLLNFLEEVAIGVNYGHINFDIAFIYFGPLCVQYFELLHLYIIRQRELKHDPTIWIEIENLYSVVTKRLSEKYHVPPGRYWGA